MSTILLDSTTVPPIACPDWCTTRHDIDPDGGHDGPSWPDVASVSDNRAESVMIAAGHNDKHGVVVYLDALALALTPEQARAAGLALLSAASWAKDHGIR
ncbi:MAG TPA: hypothetical protein VIJ07_09760 [Dermatophilaceae bacterium]|jgi:hypothetical protein